MHPVLSRTIPVANLIADTFGPICEVVLHDLTTPQQSVVYICGGDVTHREVGQSFSHLIRDVLISDRLEGDCVSNYPVAGVRGRRVKSSTALIRDDTGSVVGALCVNVDITAGNALLDMLTNFCHTQSPLSEPVPADQESVAVVDNIQTIVDDIINRTISRYDPTGMSRDEKVELVRFLSEKGVFLIKGSAQKVADRLGISRVTVYSYLDQIGKTEK